VAGGPSNYATIKPYGLVTDDSIKFTMPPLSVIYVIIDPKNVPDVEWAKATGSNIVQVKLTNAVVIPDSLAGLKILINGKENDTITKVERDANDSTLLLISVQKAIINTDTIVLSYVNGNFKTYTNIAMVEDSAIKVQNLLKGSAPIVLDARTDSAGNSVLIHFNKKMVAVSKSSFTVKVSYLDNHTVTINAASINKGDSTTYILTSAEPLYFDYKIVLSYSGTDIASSDGGKLASIDSLVIKDYSPIKPATVQKAYTSAKGDSIILVFDKILIPSATIKPYFSVTLDGTVASLLSVSVYSKSLNTLIIKPQTAIAEEVSAIKVTYSGIALLSTDSAVTAKFTNQVVQNMSIISAIKRVELASVQIFPNPFKDAFTIQSAYPYNSIEIIDLTGKRLYLKENPIGFPETNTISIQLSKGIYFMVLKGKNLNSISKLVVN